VSIIIRDARFDIHERTRIFRDWRHVRRILTTALCCLSWFAFTDRVFAEPARFWISTADSGPQSPSAPVVPNLGGATQELYIWAQPATVQAEVPFNAADNPFKVLRNFSLNVVSTTATVDFLNSPIVVYDTQRFQYVKDSTSNSNPVLTSLRTASQVQGGQADKIMGLQGFSIGSQAGTGFGGSSCSGDAHCQMNGGVPAWKVASLKFQMVQPNATANIYLQLGENGINHVGQNGLPESSSLSKVVFGAGSGPEYLAGEYSQRNWTNPNDTQDLVVEPFIAGDFNRDGSVDAADYVVWRKGIPTTAGYPEWRLNFGDAFVGGGSSTAGANVPEPRAAAILVILIGALLCRHRGALRIRQIELLSPTGLGRIRRFAPAGLALILCLSTSTASAVDIFWNPVGGSTDWGQASNWSPAIVPMDASGNGPIAVFSSTNAPHTVSLNGNRFVRGLRFQNTQPVTIQNSLLTVGGGGPETGGGITVNAGANAAINSNIQLVIGQTWTNNAAFTVGGSIANGTNLLTIAGSGSTSIFSSITGSGPLDKTGSGTLTLTNVNNFSNLYLTNGIVRVGADYSLGTGQLVFNGGTLQAFASFTTLREMSMFSQGTIDTNGFNLDVPAVVSGGGTLIKTGAGMLTLTNVNSYAGGTVINGGFLNVGNDYSLGGPTSGIVINGGSLRAFAPVGSSRTVTLGAAGGEFDILGGADSTFSGPIGGSGILIKGGAGNLNLTGNNSYAGGTNINGGSVNFSTISGSTPMPTTGNVTVASGAKLVLGTHGTYGGAGQQLVMNGGSIEMLNAGPGTLTEWNGGMVMNNDTVITKVGPPTTMGQINGAISGPGRLTTIGTIKLLGNNNYGGGTVINSGTLKVLAQSLPATGPISVNGLDTTLVLDQAGEGAIGYGGAGQMLTMNGGGLQFSNATVGSLNAWNGNMTLNNDTVVSSLGGPIVAGQLTGSIQGPGRLLVNGVIRVLGTNTYTGGTTINAGAALQIDGLESLGNTGSEVRFAGGVLQPLANGIVLNSGRNIVLAGGGGTFEVPGGFEFFVNSTITTDSNTGLTKSGSGTLTLSGSNTYTGGTHVLAGTLRGTTSSIRGPLSLEDGVQLVFDQGVTGTFNSTIAGGGHVTVTGGGRVDLTQGNPFWWNGLTINASTVGATGNSMGTGTVDVNGGGFLRLQQGGGSHGAAGQLLQLNSSHLSVNALPGSEVTWKGNVGLSGSSSITNATIEGNITGSGSLQTFWTTRLLGTNNYTGGTNNQGLLIGNTNSLQGNIDNFGNLVFDQSFNGTYSGNLSGTGTLTKSGSGTLLLTGNSTHAGDTLVGAGVLVVSNQSALGNSNLFTVSQGATLDVSSISNFFLQSGMRLTGHGNVVANQVTIANGGELGGSLTVNGSVTNAGLVAPGNSPGITFINGDYVQTPNGVLEIEVTGLTPGPTGHDQLVISGSAALAGELKVIIDGFPPSVGTGIIVLTADTIFGDFGSVSALNLPSNVKLRPVRGTDSYKILFADPNSQGCGGDLCAAALEYDLSEDGVLDEDDIPAFANALNDPSGYGIIHGADYRLIGDFDDNFRLDFDDIPGFVAALGGSGGMSESQILARLDAHLSVPEPSPKVMATTSFCLLLIARVTSRRASFSCNRA
jgi:autotransporter-associated beta strand protein